ncbi:uncharacterized protein EI90DRAFT_3031025 [Cantharellus anzutake]|uniref:uncharacterized protein n=1 Tax=Cantharellus anzutake TaxID=1750568 RepID=UPI0019077F20|nr:uncharacterized protein EI90DRAFT_3031025 [Cantharellus anzutake]KAF8343000.1 hypothetical protein EI90DRAFT_3031025 [Cantharellus anzutake]
MFWNSRAPYRYAFIIHVWVCFFGTFGVVFQFLPAVLKNYISLHRLNGYITLLLTGINVATGWTQLMFYVLGLLTLISATLGMIYVRDIRQHRKWMLRMTSMLGVIVSGRVIMLAARAIITNIGTFYALFNCEEIQALIHSVSSYPACVAAQQANTNFSSVYVGIHASMHGDKVNRGAVARLASPVGLWTALIIHIIGVEIYIRLTEKQNNHAEGFLLTRKENPYGPIGNP